MEDRKFAPDSFVLVQENERLHDVKFKSKQLTYFQDAMVRFTRNKYNVTATIILIILVLFSIFVPILTPEKLYLETNSALSALPPRVPLLEKIGIFDGTKQFIDQPIDYSTIDPETGLGYPTNGFQKEYILFDTLINKDVVGTDRSPEFLGGTNELFIDAARTAYSIIGTDGMTFRNKYTLEIDINEIDPSGIVKVYLSSQTLGSFFTSWDDLVYLGSASTAGVNVINPMTVLSDGASGYLVLKYEIPEASLKGKEYVSLNSVSLKNMGEDIDVYEGYSLSTWNLFVVEAVKENGRYVRKNAVMTIAEFRYNLYEAMFADKRSILGEDQYAEMLAANEGMEESIVVDPGNPDAWTFGEGFPLVSVLDVETKTIPGTGITTKNYIVMMDGRYALGFPDTPFFLFGTNVFGQDLFALVWLGLRTSLLLGFLAAIVNIILGVVWGATSAYYGGQVDLLMERFTDVWGSFPQITMISIISILFGPGFWSLFIFLVYDGWIGPAHVTRSQFYRYKGREYVLAARTLGASDSRIIFKHILPNALGTIVTRVILSIPSVIFLEVNLSFLGFGLGVGQKIPFGPFELTGTSIGVILNEGQQQILAGNLWLIIAPAIVVSVLMICFNMFGNALRDALNPQLRGS